MNILFSPRRSVALATALFTLVCLNSASAGEETPSWSKSVSFPKPEIPTPLFNGRDLAGWQGMTGKIWSVENGMIKGENRGTLPSSTYLFTEKAYRNFRLVLEVKQTRGTNFAATHSAVAVLGEKVPDDGGDFGFKGPLLMCCNDWGIWDAKGRNRVFPDKHKGVWLHPAEKVGDWNRIEILVLGNRIRMVANGELVIDYTDKPELLRESAIGLQIHANSKPEEYHFRGLLLSEKPEDRLLTQTKP